MAPSTGGAPRSDPKAAGSGDFAAAIPPAARPLNDGLDLFVPIPLAGDGLQQSPGLDATGTPLLPNAGQVRQRPGKLAHGDVNLHQAAIIPDAVVVGFSVRVRFAIIAVPL